MIFCVFTLVLCIYIKAVGGYSIFRPFSSMDRRTMLYRGVLSSGVIATMFESFPAYADEMAVTILEPGDVSSPTPQRTQTAVVDYTLWTGDFGVKQVDSSKGFLKGPFKFVVGVGQVISGWDKTVAEMHVGEVRRVVVPPSLGYGEKGMGPIPGGAKLYFEIELKEVRRSEERSDEWSLSSPKQPLYSSLFVPTPFSIRFAHRSSLR